MHTRPAPPALRALAASLVLALGLAACSGADDPAVEAPTDGEPSATEAATTEATTEAGITEAGGTEAGATEAGATEAGATDVAAFCEAYVTFATTLSQGPAVDFSSATPEEIAAALEEYGGQLTPALEDLQANAPEELADATGQIADLVATGLQTGEDPSADPAFQEASGTLAAFAGSECGFTSAAVTGVDYAFEGVEDSYPAGTAVVEFTNGGEEVHEMVVFRIAEGEERPIEELLELPESEVSTVAQFVGAAFGPPGSTQTSVLQLEPGRHAMVCFIPVGATSMEALEGGAPGGGATEGHPGDDHSVDGGATEEGHTEAEGAGGAELGPPHFTQGMVTEFTVE